VNLAKPDIVCVKGKGKSIKKEKRGFRARRVKGYIQASDNLLDIA
jgi:hypothetical protein